MPSFFVPDVTDAETAEGVWQGTRTGLSGAKGPLASWDITERRIYSISYTHEGKRLIATVGDAEPRAGGQTVVVILESEAYLICTYDRGVRRGEPILVGRTEVERVTDFDTD